MRPHIITKSNFKKYFLVSIIAFAAYLWVTHLNNSAFSSDRLQYTLGFEEGRKRAFEPLWTLMSLLSYSLAGELSYNVNAYLIAAATIIALVRFKVKTSYIALIIFSPGFSYFLTNALRQGVALSLFIFLLSFSSFIKYKKIKFGYLFYYLMAVLVTSLIHNSIVVAGCFVLTITLTRIDPRFAAQIKNSWFLLITSNVIILSLSRYSGMAVLFLLAQLLLFLSCLSIKKWDISFFEFGIYSTFCIIGYIGTNTGLRIVLMISLLAVVFIPRTRLFISLFGLFANPLLQYGSYLIETNGDIG